MIPRVAAKSDSHASPERQEKRVLFFSLSDPDSPDVASLIEEAETQLLERHNRPIHFALEYLNPAWLSGKPSRNKKLVALLREKYPIHAFDLVITLDEQATAVAQQTGSELFPNTPVVFCVVTETNPAKLQVSQPGRTGVVRKLNYLPTLQLALAENPGTRQVIVVAGSSAFEKLEMKAAREQFHSYEPNIQFRYWTDLKLADLKARLMNVELGTVILFLDFLADVDGEPLIPSRILPDLTDTATRPIYGAFASFVGSGIVGGSVVDLGKVGRVLGEEGGRVLNGEKPEAIPVATGEFQRNVFDWRALRRWGIPQDRLPPDSSVLYWQYSAWEAYHWRIIGLGAAVALETLLIVLLLHLRSKRKHTEDTLRRKEAELHEAQRLAQLGSWWWDPKNQTLSWSDAVHDVIGLDSALPLPSFDQLPRFLTHDSWLLLKQRIERNMETGESFELELSVVGANCPDLWLSVRGEPVRDRYGRALQLRGTVQNISERKRAEQARLRHAAIVESSDDAIVSITVEGIITSWNAGAQRIFGFREEEAIGQPIAMVVPPELEAEEGALFSRLRAGERVEHFETERIKKDGRRVAISLTVSPIRDSLNVITGFSGIARDITQQKHAQQELKKSEEKFAKAFRKAAVGIAITSASTHRYVDVNETFERMTGYHREELIGRSDLETRIWSAPLERVELAKKLLAKNTLRDAEFTFITKDGQERIALGSAELIEISGEPCVLGMAIDITDRKRAAQAVAESEKRFRLMADSAPVLMWLSGPDKLCTDFNKEWLQFTGRSMEAELGNGWSQGVHPEDLEGCLHAYDEAFNLRQRFSLEYRLRRRDGHYRWMLDEGVPRFMEDGGFAGYIGCCIDVTDQKEAKAALMNLSGRLLMAQEQERARIARELHDDINQRLALLANDLQEFEQALTSRDERERKQQVQKLLQSAKEIAGDIQHLSHQLHPSKLHYLGLAAAVRGLCQEFSKHYKLDVECVVQDLPADLNEDVSLSLYRTVQESLQNVVKHSQADHVKVELVGDANTVRLRISDDGIGFNPEEAQNHSHGLGLASMKERLRSVGGEVSIWSRSSLGTQVEANVPIATALANSHVV